MGLFKAVVVKTAADGLDDDLDQIKLNAEGQRAVAPLPGEHCPVPLRGVALRSVGRQGTISAEQ